MENIRRKLLEGIKNSFYFQRLKIRGSYGLVGDDNVDGYSAFDYMTGYDYKQGGGVIDGSYIIGTTPRNLPVTTLSWAKAKILDIGLDVAFLNNRLFRKRRFLQTYQNRYSGFP